MVSTMQSANLYDLFGPQYIIISKCVFRKSNADGYLGDAIIVIIVVGNERDENWSTNGIIVWFNCVDCEVFWARLEIGFGRDEIDRALVVPILF